MKTYEFPAKVTPAGDLELPDALAELLEQNDAARVVILLPEPADDEEDADWERLGDEEFLAGYTAADSIYDRG